MVNNLTPHKRPAQCGDICLLIEPHPQADLTPLRTRQQDLLHQHTGVIIPHVHLSCQRFQAAEACKFSHFVDLVQQGIRATMPFPLHALALQTLSVPVLNSTMLKWRIDVTPALLRFNAMVAEAIYMSGLTTLYTPGFTSNLVSALRDFPFDYPEEQLQDHYLPYHLFDAAKVVLSQICGPNEFTILARLY